MKIPEELIKQWYGEWLLTSADDLGAFLASKGAAWAFTQTKEQAISACSALRVGGTTEWTDSHLAGVEAINHCIAAISALEAE